MEVKGQMGRTVERNAPNGLKAASREIKMQKALRVVQARLHSEIKMLKSMEPIPSFIGMLWMKTNWI